MGGKEQAGEDFLDEGADLRERESRRILPTLALQERVGHGTGDDVVLPAR